MCSRLILAILSFWSVNAWATDQASAAGDTCWVYTFDATTTTWGGTFDHQGVLVVFPNQTIVSTGTSTPANEWDFWLQIGDPYTNPTPGAIYFATNSAISNTAPLAMAQLQLADIALTDDGHYEVTPRVYETKQVVNMFTANGGRLARPYIITMGTMGISFSEDLTAVTAVVNFIGDAFSSPAQGSRAPYQAELTGTLRAEPTDCLTPER